jgi:hypothetical protein
MTVLESTALQLKVNMFTKLEAYKNKKSAEVKAIENSFLKVPIISNEKGKGRKRSSSVKSKERKNMLKNDAIN